MLVEDELREVHALGNVIIDYEKQDNLTFIYSTYSNKNSVIDIILIY